MDDSWIEWLATDGDNMGLVIDRVPAKLNIQTTPSHLSIQTRRAKLELRHKDVKVDVRTELPRVVVDQYECFASAGLMGPIDLSRQEAQRAMQQALAYAGKVSGDGDSMAALENPIDPLPDIVVRDAYPEHEFGLDFIPKARPKITVTGGVQIKSDRNAEGVNNGVQGTYTPARISMDYRPSQVRIRIAQYPSIKMRYTRSSFDKFV